MSFPENEAPEDRLTVEAKREVWRCCGCDVEVPGLIKKCDCATMCAGLVGTGRHAWMTLPGSDDQPETWKKLAKHWEEIANALKRERDEARTSVGKLTLKVDRDAAQRRGDEWKLVSVEADRERGAAIARAEAAEVENERLSGVIERDRTKTAESIARLRAIVAGRSWLGEGRGNLAWDDDQYQEEFRGMIGELLSALDPLKVLASDWSDCPKDFQAARIDWKVRAEAAESAQREAVAEVARLRKALQFYACTDETCECRPGNKQADVLWCGQVARQALAALASKE